MINLLPNQVKSNIAYARHNRRLLRWAVALSMSMVGTGLIVAFGLFYINQATNAYANQVSQTKTDLDNQQLAQTEKRVEEISSSLKLMVQVLSKEILFSKLLQQVGSAMPANTSLTGISISKLTGGIDLTAVATDYNTATQIQVNLKDPTNKIFENADIVNITCAANSSDPQYPCSVVIRALFAKNNPFQFIGNVKAAGS
jgi:Tfp pilus assembly protein PilN